MSSLFLPKPLCAKAAALNPCQILTTILGDSLVQIPLLTILKFEEKNHVEIMAANALVEITRIKEKSFRRKSQKNYTENIHASIKYSLFCQHFYF